jgi:hypothetical protein
MEEAIELVAGRSLTEISTNGLRVIADKIGVPETTTNREELIVAISTIMGVSAQGLPE